MNLLNLEDVLTMKLSEIDELISNTKQDISNGYIVDQFQRKETIDKQKHEAVLKVLLEAQKLKKLH